VGDSHRCDARWPFAIAITTMATSTNSQPLTGLHPLTFAHVLLSYRDLIDSADKIVAISSSCKLILSNIVSIQVSILPVSAAVLSLSVVAAC
jgi:hypothetical protein